jgi:hypothetical protein
MARNAELQIVRFKNVFCITATFPLFFYNTYFHKL